MVSTNLGTLSSAVAPRHRRRSTTWPSCERWWPGSRRALRRSEARLPLGSLQRRHDDILARLSGRRSLRGDRAGGGSDSDAQRLPSLASRSGGHDSRQARRFGSLQWEWNRIHVASPAHKKTSTPGKRSTSARARRSWRATMAFVRRIRSVRRARRSTLQPTRRPPVLLRQRDGQPHNVLVPDTAWEFFARHSL